MAAMMAVLDSAAMGGAFYRMAPVEDPLNADANTGAMSRVIRGGGWSGGRWLCRSAFRVGNHPGRRDESIGFRVALAPVSLGR